MVEGLERLYATRDVLRRRALVHAALSVHKGDRVLDVGCGPGFYVAELLDTVGPEGAVAGVDRSRDMLAVAAKRTAGKPNVGFHEGGATGLPFEDESFDRALSVQVFEYVEDVPAALREVRRVLRPGGRHVEMEAHAFATNELSPETYGGSMVSMLKSYVVDHGAMSEDEAARWRDEQRQLGSQGEFFFAVTQFCFAATRPVQIGQLRLPGAAELSLTRVPRDPGLPSDDR